MDLTAIRPGEDTFYMGQSSTLTLFYDDGTSQSISWLPPVLWANGSSYWIEGNIGIINGTIYKDWYQSNADSGIYTELPEGSVTGLEINKENGAIASFILQMT